MLAANLLPLTGVVDQNPLLSRAGLTVAEQPGWLPGDRTIDPNDGFSSQALGRQAADQWLSGEIPYWNHYEGTGTPLAGGMQSAALFLPFILLLRFANGLLYLHVALEVLAAVGTYLLLRRLRVGHVAAVAGGIAFGVSGTMVWLTNAVMNPIPFLPWLILGIEMMLVDEDERAAWTRWTGLLVIALSLSGSLYAGFPETAYFNGLLAGAWAVFRLVQRRAQWLRRVAELGGAALIGVLLAAPVLVAFGVYTANAYLGNHDGSSGHSSLDAIGLPAVILPYVYGPIFGFFGNYPTPELGLWWSGVGGYLPMAGVALALTGLGGRRERGLKIFLFVVSLIAVARVFGLPGLSELVNLLPGMKVAIFERYAAPVIALAVIVMAALAVDEIVKGEVPRRRALACGGVSVALVALAAIVARSHVSQLTGAQHRQTWAVASVLLALGAAVIVTGAALLPDRLQRLRWMAPGMLVVEAMALFIVPQLSTKREVVIDEAPVAFLQQHLGTSSFVTLGPIAPNYGSFFHIRSINVNDLPLPKPFAELVEKRLNPYTVPHSFTGTWSHNPKGPDSEDALLTFTNAYRDAGVRYAVTRRGTITPEEAGPARLTPAFANDHFEIFEITGWKPYYEPAERSGCRVERGDFTGAIVECPVATTIVRRETFLPGWSATVNGQPTEVTDRDGLFQVVPVPAGRSEIELSYRPPFATASWILFIAGVAALVVTMPPVRARFARARRDEHS
jgi:hypothetical protein